MNSNHIHHYTLHNNYSNTNTNYPSFSSSLLEEIYRSFDDDKSRIDRRRVDRYVLEQWIDKEKEKEKEKEKNIKFRRNSMPENGNYRRPLNSSSSTSSSDSSSGIGGFSSSDTESVYGAPARMSAKIPSLKPIRTVANTVENTTEFVRKSYSGENTTAAKAKAKKSKKDGKLQHALKLYADLKKVKQPISPGGKIASFLNSLFNSGNSKKSKASPPSTAAMKSASVPSSASSYSRSCLNKTPSSAGRYERRSVRFCPVSVVVDEAGQKSVYNDVVSRMDVCGGEDEELKAEIREKQRRVEEAAKELLKNYRSNQIRKEFKVNVISNVNQDINNNNSNNNVNVNVNMRGFEDDEDEDNDDEESCCSSDLFELDNLLEIGVGDKYCQELPVYETTHVGKNRAIANGSIL